MSAVDPSVPSSTIATIDGPADSSGINDPADSCLSLHDRFDPSAGQTRWSLQPCVFVPADESPVIVAVGEPVVPHVTALSSRALPLTGASTTLVVTATVLLVAGVIAVLGSRSQRRGPQLPGTRIEQPAPLAEFVAADVDLELSRSAEIALRVLVWVVAPIVGWFIAAFVFKKVVF